MTPAEVIYTLQTALILREAQLVDRIGVLREGHPAGCEATRCNELWLAEVQEVRHMLQAGEII